MQVYRYDTLLEGRDSQTLELICKEIREKEPDLVRLKVNAQATGIKEHLRKCHHRHLHHLYTIKRYTFPVDSFGGRGIPPIKYRLLGQADWDIFCFLLQKAWEKDFLGYRYSPLLKDLLTEEMELAALQDFFRQHVSSGSGFIWLLQDDEGNDIGVCCFSIQGKNILEVLLAGILPQYRCRGYFYRLSVSGREMALVMERDYLSNGVRTDNAISLRFFDQWPANVMYEDIICITRPAPEKTKVPESIRTLLIGR